MDHILPILIKLIEQQWLGGHANYINAVTFTLPGLYFFQPISADSRIILEVVRLSSSIIEICAFYSPKDKFDRTFKRPVKMLIQKTDTGSFKFTDHRGSSFEFSNPAVDMPEVFKFVKMGVDGI